MILLDTHIFLWWQNEPELLPPAYAKILDAETETIAISSVTGWEIVMLLSKGRTQLPAPYPEWMDNVIRESEIVVLDLSLKVVEELYRLPSTFHKDPADRMIAATSLAYNIKIATADGKMTAYKFLDIL
jgi:PIN domain nuclease of toxin-antitoxin system